MLEEVLKNMDQKGNFSSKAIGKELNISKELVDSIKENLIRMGLLEKINCNTRMCKNCSCSCGNMSLNNRDDWIITEKGKKILKREMK